MKKNRQQLLTCVNNTSLFPQALLCTWNENLRSVSVNVFLYVKIHKAPVMNKEQPGLLERNHDESLKPAAGEGVIYSSFDVLAAET